MDITIQASMLPHTDPEASLAFYRDVLGFEVRNDVGYEGMRWRRTIAEMMAKGTYAMINLATMDLDTTFDRLQAAAEVVQEPTEQPYGVRDCAVRDPAGNMVRINQIR